MLGIYLLPYNSLILAGTKVLPCLLFCLLCKEGIHWGKMKETKHAGNWNKSKIAFTFSVNCNVIYFSLSNLHAVVFSWETIVHTQWEVFWSPKPYFLCEKKTNEKWAFVLNKLVYLFRSLSFQACTSSHLFLPQFLTLLNNRLVPQKKMYFCGCIKTSFCPQCSRKIHRRRWDKQDKIGPNNSGCFQIRIGS